MLVLRVLLLCACAVSQSARAHANAQSLASVSTMDGSGLDTASFAELEAANTPVVVKGLVRDWPAMHWSANRLIEVAGDFPLQFLVQQRDKAAQFHDTLESFLSHIHHSSHENAFYCMTEDLLSAAPALRRDIGDVPAFPTNFFPSLPPLARPSEAVIFGGQGSTSSLHADAYNWTGWNALFTGQKRWRFFPPSTPPSLLDVRRAAKHPNISAAYQSALNVFPHPPGTPQDSASLPSVPGAMECVQRPGDVVIIPPGWWHQVYHESTTIGFASQLLDHNNYKHVVAHVLEWVGSSAPCRLQGAEEGEGEAGLKRSLVQLFRCVLRHQTSKDSSSPHHHSEL